MGCKDGHFELLRRWEGGGGRHLLTLLSSPLEEVVVVVVGGAPDGRRLVVHWGEEERAIQRKQTLPLPLLTTHTDTVEEDRRRNGGIGFTCFPLIGNSEEEEVR